MSFKGLVFTEKIGDSPAAVNLRSGVLHINPKVFDPYPDAWKKFILLHELGHYQLQTRSELKADAFAFHHFIKEGHSLKDAVNSLHKVLDESNPAHRERIQVQLEKAIWWDEVIYQKEFKTPKERIEAMSAYLKEQQKDLAYCLGCQDLDGAKKHMTNILLVTDPKVEEKLLEHFSTILAHAQMQNYDGAKMNDMAYFFCFGNKACQERKKIKAQSKADLRKAKAQAKIVKAQATKALADQGIDSRGNMGKAITDTIKGGLGAAANVLTGGKAGGDLMNQANNDQRLPNPNNNPNPDEENNKNLPLYIGLGAAGLIVIAIIIYFVMRKKKA